MSSLPQKSQPEHPNGRAELTPHDEPILGVSLPVAAPTRHPKYYFEDETSIFLVEDRLFKVHRHFLKRDSDVFNWMFACPPAPSTQPEGTCDDKPIELAGVLCSDFESLLNFFYDGMYYSQPGRHPGKDELLHLLSVSSRYGFDGVRRCAIRWIESLEPPLDPIQCLHLAEKFDIREWLAKAYRDICQREAPLIEAEALKIGLRNTVLIAQAREKIRSNRQSHLQSPDMPTSVLTPAGGEGEGEGL
ncbi:hypothetical protein BD779DRAFT_1785670 [Infundibulicybe gibba]|nr:hypothetical protein BD779DRAFT_1785670 [Infundibulicybe gibba]